MSRPAWPGRFLQIFPKGRNCFSVGGSRAGVRILDAKKMDSDLSVYYCALSRVFAYKCTAGRHLLETFGGPAAVFAARRDELSAVLRHADSYIDQLLDPALLEWARREADWARGAGIRLLGLDEADYPHRLAECEDAPLLLYAAGHADLDASRVLAVVGTRKASWTGRDACRRLVESLSDLEEKPLIVSGLALGIDGCAHEAALAAGLPTAGVLPCGPETVYPHQHRDLALRMLERGALVTDFARGTAPVAFTFLRRNRIIAGLSDAVVVVESYRKGGGLITASLGASYNREVFAFPGRPSDASFEGCNRLIAKQEASLLPDADALGFALGWRVLHRRSRRRPLLHPGDPPLRRELLRILSEHAPATMEDLAFRTGLPARDIAVELLDLELAGRVVADGTKFYLSL